METRFHNLRRYGSWTRVVLVLSLLVAGALLPPMTVSADSVTFTTAGSGTWTAPAGVTSITVEVWGGGGGGGGDTSATNNGGGGGGGGAYARLDSYTVTPGLGYSYQVGAAGTAGGGAGGTGGNGGNSYFVNTSTLNAAGGSGGGGGNTGTGGNGGAAGTTGDHKYSGGNGATGSAYGGGGGGSGGSASAGNNGANTVPPNGASAVADGGPGGTGGNGGVGIAPGSGPGGGGGGGDSASGSDTAGGAGHAGQVRITYTAPPVSTYTTAGSYTWVAPAGVTSVKVEVWGGGGGGGGDSTSGTNGAGGGGGGAYARLDSYAVTPGNSYTLVVGAAGTAGSSSNGNGGAGGASYFVDAATLNAAGGSGGTGGSSGAGGAGGAAGATGDAKYSGGSGATGATAGGGGGGSGGSASAGNNGGNPTGATAVTGGGPGGDGGNGNVGNAPASGPGGGGGGGDDGGQDRAGGAGYAGQVIVRYNTAPTVNAGADQAIVVATANLAGTASDDGLPYPPNLTYTWSQTSGPGTTTFGNVNLLNTTATFSVVGTYVLRLTANDGSGQVWDEVTITYFTSGAPGTAPVQVFYVTLPESDGLTAMSSIGTNTSEANATTPIWTYFSISVPLPGTYVYYDQWEDGYASSLYNPTSGEIYDATTNPAGVQIWGNGLTA